MPDSIQQYNPFCRLYGVESVAIFKHQKTLQKIKIKNKKTATEEIVATAAPNHATKCGINSLLFPTQLRSPETGGALSAVLT